MYDDDLINKVRENGFIKIKDKEGSFYLEYFLVLILFFLVKK